ncbi:MAG: response regulator [Tissierellia bacterium]|nr:response regulator [Tissierellia bacterium]
MKILVVEDEFLEREAIRSLLEKSLLDSSVELAQDGEEAVRRATKCKPDLVLMDIEMPKMNGLEAAREIKDIFPEVSIVILTAYSDFEYARESLRIPVDDYLLKPIRRDKLLSVINRIQMKQREVIEIEESNISKGEVHPYFKEGNLVELINEVGRYLDTSLDHEPLLKLKKSIDQGVLETCEQYSFTLEGDFEEKYLTFQLTQSDNSILLIGMELIEILFKQILSYRRRGQGNEIEIGLQFIELQLRDKLTLTDVANEVNISPTYFSKLFKEKVGLNFIEYVKQRRLLRGKILLRHSQLSITEIAMETGFNEANYFSRVFKLQTGYSPTEYRELNIYS